MKLTTAAAMFFGCIVIMGTVRAEVKDSSASGMLVANVAEIKASPAKVYDVLVGQVGSWWDPEHTYSHDAKNLSIDPRPGGAFAEKLPNGGGVLHMTVVYASPGEMLRLSGALGPLQGSGLAGSMTWQLDKSDTGTKVTLVYSVGGYFQGGLQSIAGPVDHVLEAQLRRLKSFIETGSPAPASTTGPK